MTMSCRVTAIRDAGGWAHRGGGVFEGGGTDPGPPAVRFVVCASPGAAVDRSTRSTAHTAETPIVDLSPTHRDGDTCA